MEGEVLFLLILYLTFK